MIEMNQNAQKIYNLLFTKEFSIEKLREELATGHYSRDDVSLAGYKYVDDCIYDMLERVDDGDYIYIPIRRNFGELISGYPSSHMVQALELLLDHGLDPNRVYTDGTDGDNIMSALRYVSNGYVAADSLALLMEHGGDPCLTIMGTSLLRDLNTELLFDLKNPENPVCFDAFVHYWMVFIGYGAKLENGQTSFDICKGHDVSEMKKHRDFYFGAIHSDRSEDHIEICFFNKYTNWEIGRF